MQKKQKSLKNFLSLGFDNDELFSRSSMNAIIRALLEPVAGANAASLIFTRFKNKDGLESLIKRLEYCTNVDMVDVTAPNILVKDNYIELEFIIFTSARYNFALIWDYSDDENRNKTKLYFLANSRAVNDVYEILQNNLKEDHREKFYLHKPERRENELLNEALSNVLKKLNNSIEENIYKENDTIIDLTEENELDEKIKETSHEIKNQLSILDVYLSVFEKQTGKSKNINIMKRAIENIKFQLTSLKNYEENNIKEILVQDIIELAIDTFDEILKENGNKIEFKNVKFDVNCFADENKLLSVISNIIKNANEATKNDTIEIELKTKGNYCSVEISNHGVEIEESFKKHIFEKGYTTKRKGNGIGLYVCKNHMEKMNGKINLLNSDKTKTTFEIILPLC